MKKAVSLFLLVLFLFNSAGYYGLYLALRDQATPDLSKKIDEESYSGSDAIIIKIPMALPYPPNFDGYERADGEFEYKGEFYRIAKHNLVNDTLLVVMVKNKHKTDLKKSITDFAQANNDVPTSKSNAKLITCFTKEFVSSYSSLQAVSVGWCLVLPLPDLKEKPISSLLVIFSPPPEVLS
ncbi:MAG: hypothetical protein JST43_10910 [Bacteroidetes bacterium]|nr:hypothetical protein [Bacteroidota bacterium]MBS1540107.1 hypothetical protein [Bacteroidota bacterium]